MCSSSGDLPQYFTKSWLPFKKLGISENVMDIINDLRNVDENKSNFMLSPVLAGAPFTNIGLT